MAANYGKQFEQQLKNDFLKLDDIFVYRLRDLTNGYGHSSAQMSDFIVYKYPYALAIECKSVEGNTFSFGKLRQYDELLKYSGPKGFGAFVVIWFIDHKKMCFVPINEIKRLKEEDYKSINVKMIGDEKFKVFEVPSILKRTFLDSDYQVIFDYMQQVTE